MARTAIISDIHGELERLRLVLADIERRGIDRIVSLGDNVDERRSGLPVLTELLGREIPSVLGNCDQLCDIPEGTPESAYVELMNRTMTIGDAVLTHISPVVGARGLRDTRDAAQLFAGTRQRLCFVGHIHIPAVFVDQGRDGAVGLPFEYSEPVMLEPGRRYAICVGAVGNGRDGEPRPRYTVWDDKADTVEIVRV